jgi:hypothetical protein
VGWWTPWYKNDSTKSEHRFFFVMEAAGIPSKAA